MLPDIAIMRRLWERMAEIYGHRWNSSFGEDASVGAGVTWARGLVGLTAGQIAQGIEAAVASSDPWPPTLPAFRALCLGIPSLAAVRADLRSDRLERMPFTRMVWQHVDGYAYKRADADRADRMLREAYDHTRDAVMRGAPICAPVIASLRAPAAPPRTAAAPEVAKRHLDELAEALGQPTDQEHAA